MSIFTRDFAKDAAERAVKTIAQAAAALLGGAGFGLLDVDWVSVLSVSGLAGVVSVLTSIASAGYVGHDSASLVE
jgi:hypothetical protein